MINVTKETCTKCPSYWGGEEQEIVTSELTL